MNFPNLPGETRPYATTLGVLIIGLCIYRIETRLGNNGYDLGDPIVITYGIVTLILSIITLRIISQWIQVEQGEEAREQAKEQRREAKEQRIIEDREEARRDKAAAAAENRRLRNRGILERMHDFIFGRKD